MNITDYPDINTLLEQLKEGLRDIFDKKLIGLYLTGSLSYNDFHLKRSDIDLVVVLSKPVSEEQIKSIKNLHQKVEKNHQKWARRIECSYIPLDMLKHRAPVILFRPYVGEGKF